MTKDHAATVGGQDSSFKLQLKWISTLPTLPTRILHFPSTTWSLDFPFMMWMNTAFCNLAHTLTMNAMNTAG